METRRRSFWTGPEPKFQYGWRQLGEHLGFRSTPGSSSYQADLAVTDSEHLVRARPVRWSHIVAESARLAVRMLRADQPVLRQAEQRLGHLGHRKDSGKSITRAVPVPGRHGPEPGSDLTLDARLSTRTAAHISIVSDPGQPAPEGPDGRRSPASPGLPVPSSGAWQPDGGAPCVAIRHRGWPSHPQTPSTRLPREGSSPPCLSQADLDRPEPSPRTSLRHREHRGTVSARFCPMSYIHVE